MSANRPPASRSAKVLRTSVRTFLYSQRFTHYQRNRIFQRFTDFLAAREFPYASVTRILLIITILRVKNGACAPLRDSYGVLFMARHRDDLHFSNNRRQSFKALVFSFQRPNGTFTVKGPAGDQVLHRACVVTRTARQTFIGLMCLLYLFPVQFHAQTGRIRNGNFSVFNLQRIFGQATIALLPNPVGIDDGRITGAPAPTWVNIARYRNGCWNGSPRSAPASAKLRHADCTGKRPEVEIGKWNIHRIEHYRMAHFAPVGGDHISRDGQGSDNRETPPSTHVRRSPVLRRMDLRHR